MRTRLACVSATLCVALALPATASAAVPVGQTFAPTTADGGLTIVQTGTPGGNAYAVPSPGVITSWSFQSAGPAGRAVRFKVARPHGGASFTIVGTDGPHAISVDTLHSFEVRIPVQAGDLIGIGILDAIFFARAATADFTYRFALGDVPEGPASLTTAGAGYQLDVSAVVEPDADNDGYGDETQDCNAANPAQNTDCAPPATTITKGPKTKTKKKQATFEFAGTDARVVAGFECSLNGAPFSTCTSPATVKGKKGKNTFAVRAVDSAGNVDGSPATFDWKVKKKKKKK